MKNSMIAVAVAGLASVATAQTTITIDLSGLESWDFFGSTFNTILTEQIGAGSTITGIGFDVSIDTVSPSYLEEAIISFSNTSGSDGIDLTPGLGDNFAGSASYSSGGLVDLSDVDGLGTDLRFDVDADGLLVIELWEDYDDEEAAVDATYGAGSYVTIEYIPAPASAALLGLGGFVATRRRRA